MTDPHNGLTIATVRPFSFLGGVFIKAGTVSMAIIRSVPDMSTRKTRKGEKNCDGRQAASGGHQGSGLCEGCRSGILVKTSGWASP